MKKDQKTLLYEALAKMQEMSGDSFNRISEITRRRVAKGLLYEDVSLEQFDDIRNFILESSDWDINDFNTPEEISREISRLTAAKSRDLPSMAMENIDLHIKLLKDKSNQKIERPEIPTSFREACVVLESILDPINKTRCLDIFDKNDNMRDNVRKFIMDIVEKFKEHVNFPLNIRNIYMIGSSTGYQYSLTSDIDIEIELGITEQQKWDIIPIVPKGTLLPGTQKPLNLFILCKDESYDFDKAENVYDVVRNKWAKKTGKKDLKVPYQYIKDLTSFFMNGCDLSISAYERDLREIDEYMALDPEKQEISVKEKFEAIDRKLIDLKNDVDQMKMAHHVIFAFENEGYEGKPFKISIQGIDDPDPRYSINNLVYKMLDKHGYNEKMLKIVKDGRAKVKEIEKYISDNKDTTLQEARRDTAPNHCRRCGCATDPSEYICDDCREKERQEKAKREQEARQPKTQVTRKPGVPAGQLEIVFDEEALFEDADVEFLIESVSLNEKMNDEKFYDKYNKKFDNVVNKAGKKFSKTDSIKMLSGYGGVTFSYGLIAFGIVTGLAPVAISGVTALIPSTIVLTGTVKDKELTSQLNPKTVGVIFGHAIKNFKEYKNIKNAANKLRTRLDAFKTNPSDEARYEIKTLYKEFKKEMRDSNLIYVFRKATWAIFERRSTTKIGLLKTTRSAYINADDILSEMRAILDKKSEKAKKEQQPQSTKKSDMVFDEEVLHEYGDVGYFLTKDSIRAVILSDIVMRDANPNIAMLHGTAYNMYDFDINVVKNVKPADIKRYCRPLENVKDDKIAAALSNTIQDIVSEYETKLKKAKLAHMKLIKVDKSSCIDKKIQPIIYSNNSEDPSFEISVGYIKSTISGKRYNYKNIYHIIDIIDSGVKVLSCGDEGPEVSYSKMDIVSFVKDVEERYNAFLKGKPIKESNNLKKDNISEAISVKKEYDGKSLEVELDADLDLKDGKEHTIKSKDLLLKMKKVDGKLDLSVDIETDIKTKNDENIEKYNKKLPIDMKAAKEAGVPNNIPEVLYDALADLSDKRIGALLAFENKQNLDKYCENGEKMDCPISKDIFLTIFYPGTKVHDGATIIKDGVIKYSSVFFKNISGDDFAEHYGARHRAAMGLSKTTDGFCIVVSEESGNISFAVDGKLEVIKASDVKSSKARFIKLFNDNNVHKTVSDVIIEALLLKKNLRK